MSQQEQTGCGCPPTARKANGINHVFLTVNDLARAKPFYAAVLLQLGFTETHDFGAVVGWSGTSASFWLKQASPKYVKDTFSKDRVGLCEVAFNAGSREQIDMLAREVPKWGGRIIDQPREYPEYRPGYYAVFLADPDGIKLEAVYIPG